MIIKTNATTAEPSDFEAPRAGNALHLLRPREPSVSPDANDGFPFALAEGGEVPFEDEEALLEEALLEEEAAGEDEEH